MPNNAKNHERIDTGEQQVGVMYARSLIGATEAAGQSEAILAEFDSFIEDVLDKLPQFDSLLSTALVSAEEKAALLDRALKSQASTLFLNFLKVTANHGRLNCLRAIRRAAHEVYDKLRGRIPVVVRSATPLDAASEKQLTERLRGMLRGEPQLVREVDPELIGGLVIRVGDTVYDGSVARHLEQLRLQMIDRSVHEIQSRRDRFSHSA
ncbi:MAG: ATP synthase F1 subunit delta [Planctomycetia bacterium]|nr:ATP synthase F1 subunit delta [Planctomycetia bacterium]